MYCGLHLPRNKVDALTDYLICLPQMLTKAVSANTVERVFKESKVSKITTRLIEENNKLSAKVDDYEKQITTQQRQIVQQRMKMKQQQQQHKQGMAELSRQQNSELMKMLTMLQQQVDSLRKEGSQSTIHDGGSGGHQWPPQQESQHQQDPAARNNHVTLQRPLVKSPK